MPWRAFLLQLILFYFLLLLLFCNLIFFSFLFFLFRATPVAYGGSQARGQIGATATDLHHSHSNVGCLTHRAKPGIEPATSWFLGELVSAAPRWELLILFKRSPWDGHYHFTSLYLRIVPWLFFFFLIPPIHYLFFPQLLFSFLDLVVSNVYRPIIL